MQQPSTFDVAMGCSSCSAQHYAAAAEHADSVRASTGVGSIAGKTAAAKKAPDPNKDPSMIPGVETGEDVVAFYGKNGQDSSIKFFYCVRCVLQAFQLC